MNTLTPGEFSRLLLSRLRLREAAMRPWDEEKLAKLKSGLRQAREEWAEKYPVCLVWEEEVVGKPAVYRLGDAASLLDQKLSPGLGGFLAGATVPSHHEANGVPFWFWHVEDGIVTVWFALLKDRKQDVDVLDKFWIHVASHTLMRLPNSKDQETSHVDW